MKRKINETRPYKVKRPRPVLCLEHTNSQARCSDDASFSATSPRLSFSTAENSLNSICPSPSISAASIICRARSAALERVVDQQVSSKQVRGGGDCCVVRKQGAELGAGRTLPSNYTYFRTYLLNLLTSERDTPSTRPLACMSASVSSDSEMKPEPSSSMAWALEGSGVGDVGRASRPAHHSPLLDPGRLSQLGSSA